MNIQYAVVAFPVLESADCIEAVRQRFDPLAALLSAHVTVVFPFAESVTTGELLNHVACAATGTPAFDITLTGVSIESGGYIVLNVAAGAASFEELHSRLYTGMLAAHLSPTHRYRPHVTVARVTDRARLAPTAEVVSREFPQPILGRVTELAVFRLDGGTGSVIATSRLG